MNEFYNLASTANGSTLDIAINEDIGGPFGVTSEDIAQVLQNNPSVKFINVEINSVGGSLFQAVSIFNQLESSTAFVTTIATGVAASSGAIIFMAGDKRIVNKGAFVMIHKPMAIGINNADEMRDKANQLDKFQESIVDIYEAKTGLGRDEINTLVNVETWLDSAEALEKGFATEATEQIAEVQNKIEYEEYVNTCTSDIPKDAEKYFKNKNKYKIQRVLNSIKDNILNISPKEDDMKPDEVQNMLAEALSKQTDEFSNQLKAVQTEFEAKLVEKDSVINSLGTKVDAQSTEITTLKTKAAANTIENIVDGFINEFKVAPKDRAVEIENLKLREGSDSFDTYKNSLSNRVKVVDNTYNFADDGANLTSGGIEEVVNQLIEESGKTLATATSADIKAASAKARKKIAGGN
jgi:ATP-dependent protease ClpP protease subunit